MCDEATSVETLFASASGSKKCTPYIGDYVGTYCGYSSSSSKRDRVASGGVATALLAHALREQVVDAVGVSRIDFTDRQIGYRFDLVEDPDEVYSYGTSVYFNIPVEKHWRKLEQYGGRVGLCALPCHIRTFRKRQSQGRGLESVTLMLSLFCGHNNEPELLRFVLDQHGIAEDSVVDMQIDRTYLGGDVVVSMCNGEERTIPFRHFNVYRSLWFFSKQMCRYCDDHLGSDADVSIGDVFVPEYRRQRVKHSGIVTRTDIGNTLVSDSIAKGVLNAHEVDARLIVRAQKRVVIPSRDLMSRYYACRLAGFTAKLPDERQFRWRTFFTYSLLHLNDRVSQTRWGRRLIAWTPRPILYSYIAMIKLVNSTLRRTR